MMAVTLAQTNLQLYRQLADQGRSLTELELVVSAYKLAASVFSRRVRGNFKPFICHLTGTASVLVRYERPANEIAAGLLHACYEQGEFWWLGLFPQRPGFSPSKQRTLAASTSKEVEDLVKGFHEMRWNEKTLKALAQAGNDHSPRTRSIFIMKIANEIDEFADNGISYCQKQKSVYTVQVLDYLRKLGGRMDCATMVEELVLALEENARHQPPVALVHTGKGSFSLPRARVSPWG